MPNPIATMRHAIRMKASQKGHYIILMKKMEPGRWRGRCQHCGMEAWMKIYPRPGEQQYYGQALIEECPQDG